jgi:tetratricopeptide (TPR) repeat protein
MANNDSGDRKKSDSGVSWLVQAIACLCMLIPAAAVVVMMVIFCKAERVDSNFAINVIMAAATILTVVMVLVGLVLFSKLRDVKDEYDRICEIREKVENLWHELRKEVDEEVNRAKQVLGAVRKEIEQAVREEYDKREKQAKEAQEKWLAITAYLNKAGLLFGEKRYDEVIAEIDECLRIEPNLAEAYFIRALARLEKRDYDGAIADCDEATKRKPNLAGVNGCRGMAHYFKGEFDAAITYLSNDIGVMARPASALAFRGLAYAKKKDFVHADADCAKAIQLKPGDPGVLYNCACVYALKEDKTKAIEYLNKAVDNGYRNLEQLEKDPDFDSTREELGYKEVVARLRRLVQE